MSKTTTLTPLERAAITALLNAMTDEELDAIIAVLESAKGEPWRT